MSTTRDGLDAGPPPAAPADRFEALVRALPVAVVELMAGRVAYANGVARELLGSGPDRPAAHLFDAVHADDAPRLRACLTGGHAGPTEVRVATGPGAGRTLRLVRRGGAGDRAALSVTDVTEQVASRQHAARLHGILSALGGMHEAFLSLADPEAAFAGVVRIWVELTASEGGALAAFLQAPGPAPVLVSAGRSTPDDRAAMADFACELAAPGGPAIREIRIGEMSAWGARVAADSRGAAIVVLCGRPGGYGTGVDLELSHLRAATAHLYAAFRAEAGRQAAERESRAQRERYALAMQGSSAGLWDLDLRTGEQYWSPRLRRILGVADDAPANQATFVAGIDPGDAAAVAAAMLAHLERREPFELEYRFRRSDGEVRWCHAVGQARWDDAGVPVRMAGSLIDVTDRRNAQDALLAARRAADAANEAKSSFLANVSHEIRTPLNAILGMVEVLQGEPFDGHVRTYLDVIGRASHTLLALVDELLDLARAEAGRLPVRLGAFDVAETLCSALDAVRHVVGGGRVRLEADIAPDLPRTVVGDGVRVRQILTNLLSNAAKYTDEGSITLTARVDGGAWLVFGVRDTGAGIPSEKLSEIFERFGQAGGASAHQRPGVGIGLTISRALATDLGGDISVVSARGEGSTFTFRLPLREPVPRQPVPPPEATPVALIVDRPSTTREGLARALHAAGWAVQVFDDVDEAWPRLAHHAARAGLVVVDEGLDAAQGWRLTRAVRMTAPQASVAMLATPRERPHGAYAAPPPPVTCVVPKPVVPARLLDLLEPAARSADDAGVAPGLDVLVAEDDADNRAALRAMLRGAPHRVRYTVDGVEALDALRDRPYDVVLVDLQMPRKHGYQLAAELRRLEHALGRPRSRVVALTASAFGADHLRALAAGCDAHLRKPVRRRDLLAALTGSRPVPSHATPPDAPPHAAPDLPDLSDLVPAYLARTRDALARALACAETGDLPGVRRIAHTLAGSGASYGFPALTEGAQRVLVAAHRGDAASSHALLGELLAGLPRPDAT